MLGAVTVLLLISLVTAAGFAVIAARRQRQLGMLAAIGATRKQLRMVMVAGRAVVGVIAAGARTDVGLAAWIVAAPGLEAFAGHPIDRLAMPWALIALGMRLAVATSTAAVWRLQNSGRSGVVWLPPLFALFGPVAVGGSQAGASSSRGLRFRVLGEDGVHGLGARGDHRLEVVPVDRLGNRGAGVPLRGAYRTQIPGLAHDGDL